MRGAGLGGTRGLGCTRGPPELRALPCPGVDNMDKRDLPVTLAAHGGWGLVGGILARWGFAGRVQHKVPSCGTAAWVGLGSAFLCWASRKETPSPLPAPQAPASITWRWEERGSGDAPTRVPLLPPHGIRTGRGGERGAPVCLSPLHGLSASSKLHTHGEKPRQVPHTVGPSLSRCAGPELLWAEGSWPGR